MEAILEKRESRKTENSLNNIGTVNAEKNICQMSTNIVRIPAASGSVERVNSAFRYVRTDFWSTMSEDRFNALLLLYIHRGIKLKYKK